jgi:hypothetical protein
MSNTGRWLEDRPEVRTFTDVEAAWLAAVIDGEGSIGLYNFGKEGRRVQIQMGNTSEPFVARFREIIGCGSTVYRTNQHLSENRMTGHRGSKPMYQYSLKGSLRCHKVLKQIEPFLIVKRELALRIIEELEAKPFGRWANSEPGSRSLAAEKKRKWWAELTDERRAEIKANMRRARWG